MKRSFLLGFLGMFMCYQMPQQAIADEVWQTEQYDEVVYEDERGSTAIWTYKNGLGTIFIEGLAGQYDYRSSYHGYWVQDSSSVRCDTFREGANGEPTYQWGRVEITFIDPDFPSRWLMKLGRCEQKPSIEIFGTP